MQKPNACIPCILYGDGEGFVPDLLPQGMEVLCTSLFPETYEARTGIPRSGYTIQEYEDAYEKYAGRITAGYSHVIRCRGPKGSKLPVGAKLREGVKTCRQYDSTPESTKLIVFVGVDVAKHLRPDIKNVEDWRGFLLPEKEAE